MRSSGERVPRVTHIDTLYIPGLMTANRHLRRHWGEHLCVAVWRSLLEGPLVPSFKESLEEYNFLKSASFSRLHHVYARSWQKNIVPTLWPVNGQIVSRFGQRSDPFSGEGALHWGVDITAGTGTPVHAAADGVVADAEYSPGYGRMVVIDHGNGMRTLYGHMSRLATVPGQEVRRGEVIGYAGSTGHSTGTHLHFEVRVGGTAVNPAPYLTRSAIAMQPVRPDLPF